MNNFLLMKVHLIEQCLPGRYWKLNFQKPAYLLLAGFSRLCKALPMTDFFTLTKSQHF